LNAVLSHNFQFINFDSFFNVFYQLQGRVDMHIETNDYFIESYVSPLSAEQCNLSRSTIRQKKYVILSNIIFTQRNYIQNCKQVYINNCVYKNCQECVLLISDCNKVTIKETLFKDIDVHGIKLTACLMLVQNTACISFEFCNFDNVAQFESKTNANEGCYNNTGIIMIARNVSKVNVQNSSFYNCRVKYFESGHVTEYFTKKLLYGLKSDEVEYENCKFNNSCVLI